MKLDTIWNYPFLIHSSFRDSLLVSKLEEKFMDKFVSILGKWISLRDKFSVKNETCLWDKKSLKLETFE